MKILQFSKFFPPYIGGIESFVFDLTEELSKKITCDVLCSNTKNETVIENKGKYKVIRTASLGRIFSTSISFAMIYWLKKIGNEYDSIHMHLPNPMANLAYFLVRPRAKLILHWHSEIVRPKSLLFLYEPLQNWLLKRADKIVILTPSYFQDSKYIRKYKEKTIVIYYCINPEILKVNEYKVREIKNLFKDKPIILSLARLVYFKGFEYLIEAMKSIDAYLLIGGSGPLREKLQKQINNLNLSKKVFLLGEIKKYEEGIGSYYNACDIFCLPSIYKAESFGIVLVEAMYFGKPIVSTDIKGSGVRWVNKNNLTGLIVQPKDSNALANGINKIIKNPDLKKEFGENAKKRFEENFKMKIAVDKIFKLYYEIVCNRSI